MSGLMTWDLSALRQLARRAILICSQGLCPTREGWELIPGLFIDRCLHLVLPRELSLNLDPKLAACQFEDRWGGGGGGMWNFTDGSEELWNESICRRYSRVQVVGSLDSCSHDWGFDAWAVPFFHFCSEKKFFLQSSEGRLQTNSINRCSYQYWFYFITER